MFQGHFPFGRDYSVDYRETKEPSENLQKYSRLLHSQDGAFLARALDCVVVVVAAL